MTDWLPLLSDPRVKVAATILVCFVIMGAGCSVRDDWRDGEYTGALVTIGAVAFGSAWAVTTLLP